MFAAKASRLIPQVQKVGQQTRNLSGPPTVKVSPAEKLAHGLLIAVGVLSLPAYILVNVKNYRGQSED